VKDRVTIPDNLSLLLLPPLLLLLLLLHGFQRGIL
jgi:hypothetical protein